jgi:hypothetical protein
MFASLVEWLEVLSGGNPVDKKTPAKQVKMKVWFGVQSIIFN